MSEVPHVVPTVLAKGGHVKCPPSRLFLPYRGTLPSSAYRGYSKLRTRTVVGSYGRASPRSTGPP